MSLVLKKKKVISGVSKVSGNVYGRGGRMNCELLGWLCLVGKLVQSDVFEDGRSLFDEVCGFKPRCSPTAECYFVGIYVLF